MSALKAIGFWITGLHDTRLPAPRECIGEMSASDRTTLVEYLDRGLKFEQYRGISWCRFSCQVDPGKMGSRDLTDEEWVWPEGLSHYISNHSVILPAEFVARALSGAEPHASASTRRVKLFPVAFYHHTQSPIQTKPTPQHDQYANCCHACAEAPAWAS